LYRQHQRLQHSGIDVSRHGLIATVPKVDLAVRACLRRAVRLYPGQSRQVYDETPIKAGRKGAANEDRLFLPVYGEHNEVCFPSFPRAMGKT